MNIPLSEIFNLTVINFMYMITGLFIFQQWQINIRSNMAVTKRGSCSYGSMFYTILEF